MICDNILDALGHTPLVRLNRMVTPDMAQVLVKYEGLNVGGSIKTRTAANMIADAEARGLLKEDSVIVEPTSGNQGIGLALVGAVKGYKVVIVGELLWWLSTRREQAARYALYVAAAVYGAVDVYHIINICRSSRFSLVGV